MNVKFEEKTAIGIVTPQAALSADTVDSFREQVVDWFGTARDVKNVIIDLGQVTFLDSSGLGTLIALLKRVSERGGDLKLCGLSKKVRMVFEITRAYKVFEIVDTVDEAIKTCQ